MEYKEPHFVAESVRKGHPDKICDQISDALLDAFLREDSNCHTAIECLGTKGNIVIAGEISSKGKNFIIEDVVKNTYKSIGYNDNICITDLLSYQSKQLNFATEKRGANDQGIVYGYAERSEFNYLPGTAYIANTIAKMIDDNSNEIEGLLPDGKVLVESCCNNIQRIVVNVQHDKTFNVSVLNHKLKEFLSKHPKVSSAEIKINHDDGFHEGGFCVDTGLTGRKIMVDTYGGIVSHGGGGFSGKDPSKIDRTGAYMARFVAKNLVANGFVDKCTINVAYEFGEQQPTNLQIITENGFNASLTNYVREKFDFRPFAIIEKFDLTHFSFLPTATYGHFTNCNYPWEKIINL